MIVFSQNNLSRNFSAVLLFFYKVRCITYIVSKKSTKFTFKLEKWISVLVPNKMYFTNHNTHKSGILYKPFIYVSVPNKLFLKVYSLATMLWSLVKKFFLPLH